MISDDKRREVAARLRADHRQDHESQVTFIARMVTGKDRVTVVDVVRLPKTLADLIDPEGETMTSDNKRREVAEELRALDVSDLGDADNVIDTTEESGALFALILHVANDYRPGLHYATSHFVARDAVELFADLIDRPTCDDVGDDWTFRCSACGCELDIRDMEVGEPTMWNDGAAKVPNYCPDCGAKVVSNG